MIGYAWGKVKGTVSGWEKSHFGGYHRMITDYPYIKLDFDVSIETDKDKIQQIGWYAAEKLIKLYLIKAKALGVLDTIISHYSEVITKKDFIGREKKYLKTTLESISVLESVMSDNPEYAPLFSHYKDIITSAYLLKELPEEKPPGKQEGNGDGDEDENDDNNDGSPKSSSEGNEGESEKSSKSSPKSAQEIYDQSKQEMYDSLMRMTEAKAKVWRDTLSKFDEKPQFLSCDKTRDEYMFSRQEIKDAENLIKMLDISFEPKSDVVKSLRAGKLDVCKIAEVAAGSTSIYKQYVEDQDTKPFAVCVLADLSGSMTGTKAQRQNHVLNVLYLALSNTIPADKLWIYGHTGDIQPDIYPFYTPYDTDYPTNISEYDNLHWCQNYDGPVIEAIHKKVRETCDDRVIFISLSDGSPCGEGYGSYEDIDDMKRILERARRDDFVTVGIGIEYMHVDNLYNYYTTVDDLETFVKDVSSIVNRVVLTEFK